MRVGSRAINSSVDRDRRLVGKAASSYRSAGGAFQPDDLRNGKSRSSALDATLSAKLANAPTAIPEYNQRNSLDSQEAHTRFSAEDLQLQEDLGEGCFATVRKAVSATTGRTVAVKRIKPKTFHELEIAKREYDLCLRMTGRRVACDSIVPVCGFWEQDGEVSIVFGMMEGGSLDQLPEGSLPLDEADARYVAAALLQALRAMHKEGIAHLDVKLGNVMLERTGDFSSAHLGDLGLAHDFHKNPLITSLNGTPTNFAPEIVLTFSEKIQSYGPEVDVWAAGCVLHQLLCGHGPFDAHDGGMNLFREILTSEPKFDDPAWNHVTPEAKDFLRLCLVKDKNKRISAKRALEHPWLAELTGQVKSTPVARLKKWFRK